MHRLVALVDTLVGDDPILKSRLDKLTTGQSSTAQPTSSRTTINSVVHRAYEEILQKSRVYRRNVRAREIDSIYSYGTSQLASLALSRFSDLSFGNVSAISVFCLPVWSEDLSNATHYRFGRDGLQSTLAELMEKYPNTDLLELDTVDDMSVYQKLGQIPIRDMVYGAHTRVLFTAASLVGRTSSQLKESGCIEEEGISYLSYIAREVCTISSSLVLNTPTLTGIRSHRYKRRAVACTTARRSNRHCRMGTARAVRHTIQEHASQREHCGEALSFLQGRRHAGNTPWQK